MKLLDDLQEAFELGGARDGNEYAEAILQMVALARCAEMAHAVRRVELEMICKLRQQSYSVASDYWELEGKKKLLDEALEAAGLPVNRGPVV
jgi:hypothetical protein